MALLGVMVFWIMNCLVAPRAITDIVRRIHPTPSAFAFAEQVEHDLQNGISGDFPAEKRTQELQHRVMKQYGWTI
jgi:ABC-2 type transport system permease protein